jgi:hypothetical protein
MKDIDGHTPEDWCNDPDLVCVVGGPKGQVRHVERYTIDSEGNLVPDWPPKDEDQTRRIQKR